MISYGYKVTLEDDPLVRIAEEAMIGFAKASEPGAFLVDRFPFRAFTALVTLSFLFILPLLLSF